MKKIDIPQIEEVEKFSKKFSIRKIAEYLGWQVLRQEGGHSHEIISRRRYPNVKIGVIRGGLLAMVLESKKRHGPLASLVETKSVEFQRFTRKFRGLSKLVKMVTIFNSTGCALILKDESPESFAMMCVCKSKRDKRKNN